MHSNTKKNEKLVLAMKTRNFAASCILTIPKNFEILESYGPHTHTDADWLKLKTKIVNKN